MPKQTFFNVEPHKREAVIQAALMEFAQEPFEKASLSRIVEKCGIAKGSMYQYFADKLDLYTYIVDLAYDQKRTYVAKAFAKGGTLFSILEEYYRQSYLFALDHPLLHQVANRFWDSNAEALRSELEQGRLNRAQDFIELLKGAMESGQVNSSLNPQAVFFVYHAVGKGLVDWFEHGEDDQFLKSVLDVLRYGLEVREEEME